MRFHGNREDEVTVPSFDTHQDLVKQTITTPIPVLHCLPTENSTKYYFCDFSRSFLVEILINLRIYVLIHSRHTLTALSPYLVKFVIVNFIANLQ